MDKKISQLTTATTPLTGAEELAIVQSGVTKKATIEDVKGYKVYTALLTQSGGGSFANLTSGDLTIGVTYLIQLLEGADFSNVGGSNVEGEYFVATGTTPNSWGTGGQLEYNTGAPVVTVLENTIGNVWWTYGFGLYAINSSGLFTTNKVYVECENVFGAQWVVNLFEDYEESDLPNIIRIKNVNVTTGISTDGVDLGRIEIRVYN